MHDGLCISIRYRQIELLPNWRKTRIFSSQHAVGADTASMLPYYEAKGIVSRVDGMADIAAVSAAIEKILTTETVQ